MIPEHHVFSSFPFNSFRPSDAYMHQQTNDHWFTQWLVAWLAPSHYVNQCWFIVNWNLRNKLKWNSNRNSKVFIQENTFENVVWKMAAILSRPQCVNTVYGVCVCIVHWIVCFSSSYCVCLHRHSLLTLKFWWRGFWTFCCRPQERRLSGATRLNL